MPAMLLLDIRAQEREELGRLGKLVGPGTPGTVIIHQARYVEVLPAHAVAVPPHHRLRQTLHAYWHPDCAASLVHRYGDLRHRRAELLKAPCGGANLVIDIPFCVAQLKAFFY